MTVEQMTLYARMFLVLMFAFLIAAAAMYFLLDIRKAWQIIIGTKISVPIGRNRNTEEIRRNVKSKELSGGKSGQVSSRAGLRSERNIVPKPGTTALGTETAVLEPGTTALGTETVVLEPETAALGAETAVLEPGTAVLGAATGFTGPETAVLGQEAGMRTANEEHGETTILDMPDTNGTTLLTDTTQVDSLLDIVMDITFVHTSVTV